MGFFLLKIHFICWNTLKTEAPCFSPGLWFEALCLSSHPKVTPLPCTHTLPLSEQEDQALLSRSEWVIHCMVVQPSTICQYLSGIRRYLSGQSLPLTGQLFLTCSLVSSCMEIWDGGKTTALPCCPRSLWGCERLVLLDCIVASRWGLCSGEWESWLLSWYLCGTPEGKVVRKGWCQDAWLSRAGLRHTEKIWRELLISNTESSCNSFQGQVEMYTV